MNTFKPIFGIAIAIIFIIIGFYLIGLGDQLSVIIGYANVIFWSCLLLFVAYKILLKK